MKRLSATVPLVPDSTTITPSVSAILLLLQLPAPHCLPTNISLLLSLLGNAQKVDHTELSFTVITCPRTTGVANLSLTDEFNCFMLVVCQLALKLDVVKLTVSADILIPDDSS